MKQCQAYAASSGDQCKKKALLGHRYCFYHQSWGFNVIVIILTLIIGAILGLITDNIYRKIVPSREIIELKTLKKQFEESQKSPDFQFLLNGKLLYEDSIVRFPAPNKEVTLNFGVKNIGTLSSMSIVLTARLPSQATHVKAPPPWKEHPPRFIGNGDVEEEPQLRLIAFRTNEIIAPESGFQAPSIIVSDPNRNSPILPFFLQVASDKSDVVKCRVHIVFKEYSGDIVVRQLESGENARDWLK
jgi:hypothetical protein